MVGVRGRWGRGVVLTGGEPKLHTSCVFSSIVWGMHATNKNHMDARETGLSADEDVSLPPVDEQRTSEWIVVLAAAYVDYRLSYAGGLWQIHVPLDAFDVAEREIQAYEEERVTWDRMRTVAPSSWLAAASSGSPLWVAGMLIAFYLWTGPFDRGNALVCGAALDTNRLFGGEVWRLVTALTVHSGLVHLAGNVVSMLLFGYAVCTTFGGGLAWIMILGTGIIGNAVSAAVHGPDQLSVGASTACFGALGILTACQALRNLQQFGMSRSIWNRVWLPIGAGLGLLSLLGTGVQSDLLAHLFGFLSGWLLCMPFIWWRPPTLSAGRQQLLQLVGLFVVMFAWRLVLMAL
jgi:rhomboid protease GluP